MYKFSTTLVSALQPQLLDPVECFLFHQSFVAVYSLFVHHMTLAYRPLESISLRLSLITVAVAYLASSGCRRLATSVDVTSENLLSREKGGEEQQQRNVYFIAVLKEFHLLADRTATCPSPCQIIHIIIANIIVRIERREFPMI